MLTDMACEDTGLVFAELGASGFVLGFKVDSISGGRSVTGTQVTLRVQGPDTFHSAVWNSRHGHRGSRPQATHTPHVLRMLQKRWAAGLPGSGTCWHCPSSARF